MIGVFNAEVRDKCAGKSWDTFNRLLDETSPLNGLAIDTAHHISTVIKFFASCSHLKCSSSCRYILIVSQEEKLDSTIQNQKFCLHYLVSGPLISFGSVVFSNVHSICQS